MERLLSRKKVVSTVALLLALSLTAASAQSMKGHGMPPARAGSGEAAFLSLWKETAAEMKLTKNQTANLVRVLENASLKLSQNWSSLQDLRSREAAAGADSRQTIRRRIALAEAERDLIVAGAETDLRDFLAPQELRAVMAGGFHGVSPEHTGNAHAMDMPTGHAMAPLEDLEMRLAEAALGLNEKFLSASLGVIIGDLKAR